MTLLWKKYCRKKLVGDLIYIKYRIRHKPGAPERINMKRSKSNLLCFVLVVIGVLSVIATKEYSVMYMQGVYGAFTPADPTWHITFALICDALVCSVSLCYLLMSQANRMSFDETFASRRSVVAYSAITAVCTIILTAIAVSFIIL